MIGDSDSDSDSDSDVAAGRAAGTATILLRSGQPAASGHADFVVDDLAGAVRLILAGLYGGQPPLLLRVRR
jgi:D-glycero-D-manno-heptose 1,7-bisphosphate phosphatase